jgi:hypothetical protein
MQAVVVAHHAGDEDYCRKYQLCCHFSCWSHNTPKLSVLDSVNWKLVIKCTMQICIKVTLQVDKDNDSRGTL